MSAPAWAVPAAPAAWRRALALAAAALLALALLYAGTVASMAAIWWRSDTFAHGFVILPISLYLVWRRRRHLAAMAPRGEPRALAVLAVLALVWLVARVGGVLVAEQLAFVAMIPAAVTAVLGAAVARAVAFPLAYLFFMVPVGEALVPPLMEFTADFTVALLRLTGIPVYREGLFFSIPSGDWSVVEGCSGVRYLIASTALGTLYAYLTYTSLRRRLLFIAASVVTPIVANGLRAYMIVMIAHLSDMRLALGVDHIIYGWVFFGLVIGLMFWIGGFWREDERPPEQAPQAPGGAGRVRPALVLAAVAVAGLGPGLAAAVQARIDAAASARLALPAAIGPWTAAEGGPAAWRPRYLGTDAELQRTYRDAAGRVVGVYLAYYADQRQDHELVNSQNVMVVQKDPVWRQTAAAQVAVPVPPGRVREAVLRSAATGLVAWSWDRIGGVETTSPYVGKLAEVAAKILHGDGSAVGVVVYAPFEEDPAAAREVLAQFLRAAAPVLREAGR
ncbi:exosortase A [Inmirania thermothiophila]|uniref:Exosortase A n=1 Tax=Inmirania thermothiophila TaxID=1750597 RepID=A0A3N1Y7F9_9GAMM|nr:exosortase A [Inmirania thermothiophila]ROR34743.1 exosortase A [Inmirania thermothiophila]